MAQPSSIQKHVMKRIETIEGLVVLRVDFPIRISSTLIFPSLFAKFIVNYNIKLST